MKVGFVCTNFNNSTVTRAAVASLRATARWADVQVVIVDNASSRADVAALEQLARDYPEIDLVLHGSNIGYFPGLNIGIRRLRQLAPEIEHMIVGNNDLAFPPDFVETLIQHRSIFDTWAVVSPDLVTPEGVHQNPHVVHPIGRFRRWVWSVYFMNYPGGILIKRVARMTRAFTARREQNPNGHLHRTAGPVEQGYGACYLLGPMFFRHFGQLAAPTFMMQEEFFLAEQLKLIGQRAYYDPRFVVYHVGHATTDRLPSRRHWTISRAAHRTYRRYVKLDEQARRRFIESLTGEAP